MKNTYLSVISHISVVLEKLKIIPKLLYCTLNLTCVHMKIIKNKVEKCHG